MDCYKDMDSWIKDNDVIVSTIPKGGTTWMLYLSHLIRIKGDDETIPWHDINTNTPWPSFIHYPGQSWKEIKELLNSTILHDDTKLKDKWDHPSYLFRVWKAHEMPVDELGKNCKSSVLPLKSNKKVKFVAMYRDLPDILASFYPFVNNHTKEFKRLWGGMPPTFNSVKEMLNFLFKPHLGSALGYDLLLYLKVWWKYKQEPNVLLLHYNDAITNLEDVTRKLAKFYEVDLTDDEIKKIADKSSFQKMKHINDKFSYRVWGATHVLNGTLTAVQVGHQIRKGISGDSKVFFSKEELEYINNIVNDYFKDDPDMLYWSKNGGAYR